MVAGEKKKGKKERLVFKGLLSKRARHYDGSYVGEKEERWREREGKREREREKEVKREGERERVKAHVRRLEVPESD